MSAYQWDFAFLASYRQPLIDGTLATMRLSLVIIVAGMFVGCLFALARVSRHKAWRVLGTVYVELFRNVPALVLLFWFFYAIPTLTGVRNERFLTAAVAFSLYTGAYFCEIFRAGIESIGRGQWDAGAALGFSRGRLFVHLILPQTVKRVLPSLTNEIVEVVKISAVTATIAYPELLYQAKLMSDTEYRPVEAYSAVAVLMIGFILVLSTLSYALERRQRASDRT